MSCKLKTHIISNKRIQKKLKFILYFAEIICEAPEPGSNTNPIPNDMVQLGMRYLETYTYSCLPGFETSDDVCTVCLPNGMLSLEATPNCTGVYIAFTFISLFHI